MAQGMYSWFGVGGVGGVGEVLIKGWLSYILSWVAC